MSLNTRTSRTKWLAGRIEAIGFGVPATVSCLSHLKLYIDLIDVSVGRHVTGAGKYIPVLHQRVTPHRLLSLSESLHCFARLPHSCI